ncbi:MAG: c-type cytochrome [Thiohalomonadales bacterium]
MKIVKYNILFIAFLAIIFSPSLFAKNYIYTADGRAVPIKGGVFQPDLSMYRSPLHAKVIDRRFYTNEATFMANEGFKMGMEGWNDMVKAAMPVSYRRAFQWVVARETYMYARNLLDYIGGRSHSGVHIVQGPYWTMKARRHTNFNRLQRDRGERVFSNKDVMLGFYLPIVYQRTGFPRVFDDVQLSYLQYKSVDPRFLGYLDNTDSYVDPMSGKDGGWGVENTYFNDYPQRFDYELMDTTFNMGTLGQFLKRRSQWIDRFFQSERTGEVEGSHDLTSLLGNDAEEGMRGWGLAQGAVNVMLQVKSTMFTDGKKLIGLDPSQYDPSKGFKYLPHEIEPNILWVGDMPERLWSMHLKDNSSQLWDQASWLWGTSAFAVAVKRRSDFFTSNPPVDGGLMEKGTTVMAEAMANVVLKNLSAMHTLNGVFVSQWTPASGTGKTINMRDLSMAITALHDFEQSWQFIARHKDARESAIDLLKNNADFLLKVQNADGSFNNSYDVSHSKAIGPNDLSENQWQAVRALIAAYYTTENQSYLQAARKAFNFVNKEFWVEKEGLYRTQLNNDIIEITPYRIGIALGAMREMLFVTPAHLVDAQIERLTRWWIQSVDQSGLMQAETKYTGELYTGFASGDDDADGIPVVSSAYGKYGTAPVMAGKVVVNVGAVTNKVFAAFEQSEHDTNKYSKVKMDYSVKTDSSLSVPIDYSNSTDWFKRKPMQREDGSIIPLQAALKSDMGLGTKHDLSGKQIFEANCSICHGEHGEGHDGKALVDMMTFNHDVMFHVVQNGRFEKSMPPWGVGNDDGYGGTLKKDEINRIIGYVQSDEFRSNYKKVQSGEVLDGALPKDIWFYLSRENVKAKGKIKVGKVEAQRIISRQSNPAETSGNWWENLRLQGDPKVADRR